MMIGAASFEASARCTAPTSTAADAGQAAARSDARRALPAAGEDEIAVTEVGAHERALQEAEREHRGLVHDCAHEAPHPDHVAALRRALDELAGTGVPLIG